MEQFPAVCGLLIDAEYEKAYSADCKTLKGGNTTDALLGCSVAGATKREHRSTGGPGDRWLMARLT